MMCSKLVSWKHCLSLGAAVLCHSLFLALVGVWNILLVLNIIPWKRSLITAALEVEGIRHAAIASALRIGILTVAASSLTLSALTALCLCSRSRKIAYVLGWMNIFNAFIGLLLLFYVWTGFGIMVLSANATLGELILWGNVDLLYLILTAVPLTKIYASLGNVYTVGGSGFEGKGFRQLAPQGVCDDIMFRSSLKMAKIGKWGVGLSLEHGATLWSVFCFATSTLDLSVFWVKLTSDDGVPTSDVGILFLVQGIIAFFIAISALSGSATETPFFTLMAAVMTGLVLPISLALLVLLSRNIYLEQSLSHPSSLLNLAAFNALSEQILFIALSIFAISTLCSLFSKQTVSSADGRRQHVQKVDLDEERETLLGAATEV